MAKFRQTTVVVTQKANGRRADRVVCEDRHTTLPRFIIDINVALPSNIKNRPTRQQRRDIR